MRHLKTLRHVPEEETGADNPVDAPLPQSGAGLQTVAGSADGSSVSELPREVYRPLKVCSH